MLWRFIFTLVFVVVSGLFLMQSPPSPSSVTQIPHIDKVVHFVLFFVLAATMHLAFRPRMWFALPLLLGYAVAIEVIQHYVPGRGADVWDVVADMVGVAAFYLLRSVYKSTNRKRQKR